MVYGFGKFLRDAGGNVMILSAIAIVPIILAVGSAVDYGRGVQAKTLLQSAADAAALAGASTLGLDDAVRISRAQATFVAQSQEMQFPVTPQVDVSGSTLTVTAQYYLPTTFMAVGGYTSMELNVSSKAAIPSVPNIEVAFVLDYSSSMDVPGKYDAMRDAAVEMVSTINQYADSNRAKFALVPFARGVYASLPGSFVLGADPLTTWTNCTIDRRWPHNTTDATPTSDIATQWGRTDGDDVISSTEYEHCDNFANRSLTILPLTNNHQSVIDQLNAMVPYSGTNISVGVEFGWHVLSPNEPWTEGVPYSDTETQKYLVLLTDGRQSQSAFGDGMSFTTPNGDQNTAALCTAMKAQNIRIMTIAFDIRDQVTRDMLVACASASNYFHEPSNGAELTATFKRIGQELIGYPRLVE